MHCVGSKTLRAQPERMRKPPVNGYSKVLTPDTSLLTGEQEIRDFPPELHRQAKDTFRIDVQAIMEQILDGKVPYSWKNS